MGVDKAGRGPLAAAVNNQLRLQVISAGWSDDGDTAVVYANIGGIDLAGENID